MSDNINLQWLNANTERAYPLQFDISRRDTTGAFEIPHGLIVDMGIYGNSSALIAPSAVGGELPQVWIETIEITGVSVTLVFYSKFNGITGPCGSVAISRSAKDYSSHAIRLKTISGNYTYAGFVTIGSMSSLPASTSGLFKFTAGTAGIEFSCIHFDTGRQYVLTVVQAGKAVQYMEGNIRLQSGSNVRLTPLNSAVMISAAAVDNLQPVCDPVTDYWRFNTPIKTINGVPPRTADGAFFMINDPCTSLAAGTNSLTLTNDCGTPCCSNTTLEKLSVDVENVLSSFTSLETLVHTLEQSLQQFEATVLASRSD